LSVGLGQDPLDTRQLPFVDSTKALPALPFMAVVLAPHGFWMTDSKTGMDVVRVMHGEQSMRFEAPLPVDSEVIGRSRVVDIVDKGEGKGALLYMEKELLDAATGQRLATLESTVFMRGNGGLLSGKSLPLDRQDFARADTRPNRSRMPRSL
jgi:hypothetical protein